MDTQNLSPRPKARYGLGPTTLPHGKEEHIGLEFRQTPPDAMPLLCFWNG